MFVEPTGKLVLLSVLFILCAGVVFAQEPQPTPQPTPLMAPPPLQTIPKEERTQINGATDPKQRVRITIEFAGTHLTTAEKLTAQSNYEEASREVGTYNAIIQNLLTFLADQKRDSNKTRDMYKRLELALRGDGPRLTAMRRTTPLEFAVWIKKVEDFARESRTEALNSFYGHTVVREPESNQKASEKPKESPTPQNQQP
jgi:hypothetical protein